MSAGGHHNPAPATPVRARRDWSINDVTGFLSWNGGTLVRVLDRHDVPAGPVGPGSRTGPRSGEHLKRTAVPGQT